MNTYVVEINGQPFVVHAYTADDAERVALAQFDGLVTSLVIRVVADEAAPLPIDSMEARARAVPGRLGRG